MDLEKSYGITSESLENDGAWVELESGAKVKVGRKGNPRHQKALKRLLSPFKRYQRMQNIPEDVEKKLEAAIIEAMAEGLLFDWSGIQVGGVDVPYSKQNAIEALTKFKRFREDIEYLSDEAETFRQQELEEGAKNS